MSSTHSSTVAAYLDFTAVVVLITEWLPRWQGSWKDGGY